MTVAPSGQVILDGILDEIEARVFSRRVREPSFYQGLFRPLLLFNRPLSPQDTAVSLFEIREQDRPLLT